MSFPVTNNTILTDLLDGDFFDDNETKGTDKTDDLILGDWGNDTLKGLKGTDALFGNAGDDELRGGKGKDYLDGGSGDDQLFGGNGQDHLFGDVGDDILHGGLGADVLLGDAGDDILFGGDKNDLLDGGDGADVLFGEKGADVLLGGSGDDVLFGNKGKDELFGGSGDNWLVGGKGADMMTSDSLLNQDRFLYNNPTEGGKNKSGFDEIINFKADQLGVTTDFEDLIVVDSSGFTAKGGATGLTPGGTAKVVLGSASLGGDAGFRLFSDGTLAWDPNGGGINGSKTLAILSGDLANFDDTNIEII